MKRYLDAFKGEGESKIFSTLWDLFYLSFLVGLAADKKTPEAEWQESMEMEREMANYSEKRFAIIATLFIKKLNKRGREVKTTIDLENELNNLVNSKNLTFNEEGFTLFNEYAYWGFEEIEKRLARNPANPATTFIAIFENISKNLDQ
tara:strand:+ start:292 stop:735 length:444 start_codon:yes stop_codon:yes gene_type:complete